MKRMRDLFFCCWLLFAPCAATAATDAATAEALMRATGMWDQLADFAPQIRGEFMTGLAQVGAKATLDLERVSRTIEAAYSADRLRSWILASLVRDLDPAHLPSLRGWYDSTSGKAVTGLEKARSASRDDLQTTMTTANAMFEKAPPERRALLVEILSVSRALDVMTEAAISTAMAIQQGTAIAAPYSANPTLAELRNRIEAQRPQIREALATVMLASFTIAYGPLPTEELAKYVAFLRSDASRHFSGIVARATVAVMADASSEVGRGILASRLQADTSRSPAPEILDVVLLPTEEFPFDFAVALAKVVASDTGLRVRAFPNIGTSNWVPFSSPPQYDPAKLKELASPAITEFKRSYGGSLYVLLTARDINDPAAGLRFLFAQTYPADRVAVISAARMLAGPDGQRANQEIIGQRLRKMILRSVGFVLYDMPRSSNPRDLAFSPLMSLDMLDGVQPVLPVGGSNAVLMTDEAESIVISVPASRLTLTLPKSGFSRARPQNPGSSADSRRFFLADGRAMVSLTGRFDASERFSGVKEPSVGQVQGRPLSVANPAYGKLGEWEIVEYEAVGAPVELAGLVAHLVKAGTWIELHLGASSARSMSEKRAQLADILRAIRVTEKPQ